MALLHRHPDRPRPAVGGPRVRRACRRAASASTGCSARSRSSPWSRTAATAYVMIVALPERQPDASARSPSASSPSQVEGRREAARLLRRLPQPRRSTSATCRPAAAGATSSSPTPSQPGQTTVYFAQRGPAVVDRAKRTRPARARRTARGTRRWRASPTSTKGPSSRRSVLNLDPQTVFPRPPPKGVHEMTIAELRASHRRGAQAHGDPALRRSGS